MCVCVQEPRGFSNGRKERFVYVPKSDQQGQPRGFSSGRKERFVNVPESDEQGQSSTEPKTSSISGGVKSLTASDLAHQENSPALSDPNCSDLSFMGEEETQVAQTPSKVADDNVKQTDDNVKQTLDLANKLDISCQDVGMSLPSEFGDKVGPSPLKGPKTPASGRKPENSESSSVSFPFDICSPKASSVKLKPSLLVMNRERRNEMKRITESSGRVLRPGMVLLRGYISLSDQVLLWSLSHNIY